MTELTLYDIENIKAAREKRDIEQSLKHSSKQMFRVYEGQRKLLLNNINREACQIMRIKIDVLSHHHYLMKDWRWHGFEMMYFGWTSEQKLQELKRLNVEYDKLLYEH